MKNAGFLGDSGVQCYRIYLPKTAGTHDPTVYEVISGKIRFSTLEFTAQLDRLCPMSPERQIMKKISLFFLAVCMSAALGACGSKEPEQTPVESKENVESEAPSSESDSQEGAMSQDAVPTSYLTGLECSVEERKQRPMAVMINNIKAGTPQAGIGQASVIYEAPVEQADITRLMALFEDWQDMETIGYIRSSRDYFVYAALEFDAIYAHFGQATVYVGEMLNSDKVDNVSGATAGIDRPASKAFMRTSARKSPHNVYTTGKALLEAVGKFDYSLTYHDTHKQKFSFAPLGERAEYKDGKAVSVLYPGGKTGNIANGYSHIQARFEYNEEDGKYYRYEYGGKHIDELTGEQLAVDNVIFQYTHGEFRDAEGYMAFDCHGGWEDGADLSKYKVQVFTGGRMVEGTWSRYSDTDPALYVDKDGNPIPLNRGKTWICLIWDEHAGDVVLE